MSRTTCSNSHRIRRVATAIAVGGALSLAGIAIPGVAASAAPAAVAGSAAAVSSSPKLANLAHLDFLLDSVPLLPGVANHTTYQASSEPTAQAPWVYANRETDGSFQRVEIGR